MEPLKALLQIVQHLKAKHGEFLHGKQKFFAVHQQQFTFAAGHSCAKAAMGGIHQSADPKAASRSDRFEAIITPTHLDLARNDAINFIADLAGLENHISLIKMYGVSLACKGCDGRQLKICGGFHEEK
jgi:hypothetical protein